MSPTCATAAAFDLVAAAAMAWPRGRGRRSAGRPGRGRARVRPDGRSSPTARATIWSSARSPTPNIASSPTTGSKRWSSSGGTLADLKGMWRDRQLTRRSIAGRCERAGVDRCVTIRPSSRAALAAYAAAVSVCRRAGLGALLPWLARGPILPGEFARAGEPQRADRQYRRDHHRLLDAAVDRDLSRHPLELCDLPAGADRPRAGRRRVRC